MLAPSIVRKRRRSEDTDREAKRARIARKSASASASGSSDPFSVAYASSDDDDGPFATVDTPVQPMEGTKIEAPHIPWGSSLLQDGDAIFGVEGRALDAFEAENGLSVREISPQRIMARSPTAMGGSQWIQNHKRPKPNEGLYPSLTTDMLAFAPDMRLRHLEKVMQKAEGRSLKNDAPSKLKRMFDRGAPRMREVTTLSGPTDAETSITTFQGEVGRAAPGAHRESVQALRRVISMSVARSLNPLFEHHRGDKPLLSTAIPGLARERDDPSTAQPIDLETLEASRANDLLHPVISLEESPLPFGTPIGRMSVEDVRGALDAAKARGEPLSAIVNGMVEIVDADHYERTLMTCYGEHRACAANQNCLVVCILKEAYGKGVKVGSGPRPIIRPACEYLSPAEWDLVERSTERGISVQYRTIHPTWCALCNFDLMHQVVHETGARAFKAKMRTLTTINTLRANTSASIGGFTASAVIANEVTGRCGIYGAIVKIPLRSYGVVVRVVKIRASRDDSTPEEIAVVGLHVSSTYLNTKAAMSVQSSTSVPRPTDPYVFTGVFIKPPGLYALLVAHRDKGRTQLPPEVPAWLSRDPCDTARDLRAWLMGCASPHLEAMKMIPPDHWVSKDPRYETGDVNRRVRGMAGSSSSEDSDESEEEVVYAHPVPDDSPPQGERKEPPSYIVTFYTGKLTENMACPWVRLRVGKLAAFLRSQDRPYDFCLVMTILHLAAFLEHMHSKNYTVPNPDAAKFMHSAMGCGFRMVGMIIERLGQDLPIDDKTLYAAIESRVPSVVGVLVRPECYVPGSLYAAVHEQFTTVIVRPTNFLVAAFLCKGTCTVRQARIIARNDFDELVSAIRNVPTIRETFLEVATAHTQWGTRDIFKSVSAIRGSKIDLPARLWEWPVLSSTGSAIVLAVFAIVNALEAAIFATPKSHGKKARKNPLDPYMVEYGEDSAQRMAALRMRSKFIPVIVYIVQAITEFVSDVTKKDKLTGLAPTNMHMAALVVAARGTLLCDAPEISDWWYPSEGHGIDAGDSMDLSCAIEGSHLGGSSGAHAVPRKPQRGTSMSAAKNEKERGRANDLMVHNVAPPDPKVRKKPRARARPHEKPSTPAEPGVAGIPRPPKGGPLFGDYGTGADEFHSLHEWQTWENNPAMQEVYLLVGMSIPRTVGEGDTVAVQVWEVVNHLKTVVASTEFPLAVAFLRSSVLCGIGGLYPWSLATPTFARWTAIMSAIWQGGSIQRHTYMAQFVAKYPHIVLVCVRLAVMMGMRSIPAYVVGMEKGGIPLYQVAVDIVTMGEKMAAMVAKGSAFSVVEEAMQGLLTESRASTRIVMPHVGLSAMACVRTIQRLAINTRYRQCKGARGDTPSCNNFKWYAQSLEFKLAQLLMKMVKPGVMPKASIFRWLILFNGGYWGPESWRNTRMGDDGWDGGPIRPNDETYTRCVKRCINAYNTIVMATRREVPMDVAVWMLAKLPDDLFRSVSGFLTAITAHGSAFGISIFDCENVAKGRLARRGFNLRGKSAIRRQPADSSPVVPSQGLKSCDDADPQKDSVTSKIGMAKDILSRAQNMLGHARDLGQNTSIFEENVRKARASLQALTREPPSAHLVTGATCIPEDVPELAPMATVLTHMPCCRKCAMQILGCPTCADGTHSFGAKGPQLVSGSAVCNNRGNVTKRYMAQANAADGSKGAHVAQSRSPCVHCGDVWVSHLNIIGMLLYYNPSYRQDKGVGMGETPVVLTTCCGRPIRQDRAHVGENGGVLCLTHANLFVRKKKKGEGRETKASRSSTKIDETPFKIRRPIHFWRTCRVCGGYSEHNNTQGTMVCDAVDDPIHDIYRYTCGVRPTSKKGGLGQPSGASWIIAPLFVCRTCKPVLEVFLTGTYASFHGPKVTRIDAMLCSAQATRRMNLVQVRNILERIGALILQIAASKRRDRRKPGRPSTNPQAEKISGSWGTSYPTIPR